MVLLLIFLNNQKEIIRPGRALRLLPGYATQESYCE